MQTEMMKITPKVAAELLATNPEGNRTLRENKVDEIAAEMLSERWVSESGETIKLDRAGRLIDGQHRLHALIKAKRTFYFLVVKNLDPKAFQVIDTGTSRNGGDVMHIAGVKNSNVMSAGIKIYHALSLQREGDPSKVNRLSNFNLLSVYRENPDFWQSYCVKSHGWYKEFSHVIGHSLILGLSAFLAKHSKKSGMIDTFFDQLCTDGTDRFSTIKLLRKRLLSDRMSKNEKLSSKYKYVYIIKTWNAFVTDKPIAYLKFDPNQEEFPKAI